MPEIKQFESCIEPWLRHGLSEATPGLAVWIGDHEKELYRKNLGLSNLGSGEHLSDDHRFCLGSQTKTVTAVALMQLVEQGLVSLDSKLVDFVPELKKGNDKRILNIEIGQLLMHASGVQRDMADNDYWEGTRQFPEEKDLVEELARTNLVFDPGATMKYSNFGYGLLGIVISEASGISYEEYVKTKIIRVLELGSLSFEHELAGHIASAGYVGSIANPLQVKPQSTNGLSAAAGLWGTVEDSGKFFRIFTNEVMRRNALLKEETIRRMLDIKIPVPGSSNVEYGLGVDIGVTQLGQIIGHGGGYPGHRSGTIVDPERNIVVSCAANHIGHDAFMDSMNISATLAFLADRQSDKEIIPIEHEIEVTGLWGLKKFFSIGDKLVGFDPRSRWPITLDNIDILVPVGGETYRINHTNAFNPIGERVDFSNIDLGFISWAGRTMHLTK